MHEPWELLWEIKDFTTAQQFKISEVEFLPFTGEFAASWISPNKGLREYGDVQFADETNKKYPIETPEHVRAAWSYFNHKDNASKYDKDQVKTIKERIKRAGKKHGVEIEAD